MNPQEKWKRMENPTTAADYGLSMSMAELRQVPDGRKMLCGILREKCARDRNRRYAR